MELFSDIKSISDDEQEIFIEGQYVTHEQKFRNNRSGGFNQTGIVKTAATNSRGKLKRDKREHCMFCEQNVTNFSRHLIRRHDKETEVVRILSLENKSVERKKLLDKIRKGGKFSTFSRYYLMILHLICSGYIVIIN